MKTILIPVRTDRLTTKEDMLYAMVNRQEQIENREINYPILSKKKMNMVFNRITAHSFFSNLNPVKYLP